MSSAKDFFTPEQQESIVAAIKAAEKRTSGEIRVHIDNKVKGEATEKAAGLFHWLKMDETALRNGVLIYLAVEDHKFAIIGDQGINEVVPDHFWEDTRDEMVDLFKKGDFVGGLVAGITHAGEQLRDHFPFENGDQNELSDDISFGHE